MQRASVRLATAQSRTHREPTDATPDGPRSPGTRHGLFVKSCLLSRARAGSPIRARHASESRGESIGPEPAVRAPSRFLCAACALVQMKATL
jgi:hypothetical protein